MTQDAATYLRIPLEVFSQGKVELIDEIFAEDYVEHIELPPGVPPGIAAVKAFVPALRDAFKDFAYEILQHHEDGDMQICYVRASGTMTGDFMGMPASGKSAAWEEVHIGRMAGGKVAEHWAVIDQLGMLRQLGFVSPPGG